jgi:Legionella pneumophila major outer membrane protein precursor
MFRGRKLRGTSGVLLSAGVALGIVLSAGASARAADVPVFKAKGPERGLFRWTLEAGAFWTGGDPIPFNTGDIFGRGIGIGFPFILLPDIIGGGEDPNVRPKVGWDVAIGFDYRFPGTPWHINGQFSYGEAKGSKDVASSFSLIQPPPDTSVAFSSATNANLKKRHWIVDFGAGYDIFTGASNRPALLQANFGMRIAEIKATNRVNTSGSFFTSDGVDTTTATFSQSDRDVRSFLGLGPRVGVEGAIPLWGAFGFDYAANVAVLWGQHENQLRLGQCILRCYNRHRPGGDQCERADIRFAVVADGRGVECRRPGGHFVLVHVKHESRSELSVGRVPGAVAGFPVAGSRGHRPLLSWAQGDVDRRV